MDFTPEEAEALLGSTVRVKVDHAIEIHDGLRLAPDQEGTIIGVSGAYTPHGEPTLSIALQFWPMSDESLPIITLVEKAAFQTYFVLTRPAGTGSV